MRDSAPTPSIPASDPDDLSAGVAVGRDAPSQREPRAALSRNVPGRDEVAEPPSARTLQGLLARLSRPNASGGLIPEIEGLRFVAIALVVLFHLAGHVAATSPVAFDPAPEQDWAFRLASHGDRGVQLFFVISGFVVALPFARFHLQGGRRVSMAAYVKRRVTRLEPPYIASLALLYALLVLVNRADPLTLLPHFGASVLYLHNLIYGEMSLVNPVAWSLEVEIQFYVLAPLLAYVFRVSDTRIRRGILVSVILIASAVPLAFPDLPYRFALSIGYHIQHFLVGFLLCDLYLESWQSAPRSARHWDLVTLLGWPLLAWLWGLEPLTRVVTPVVVLVLFVAAFKGPLTRKALSNKWVTVTGGMCYSIYLVHFQVTSAVGRLTVPNATASEAFWLNYAVQIALVLPVVFVASAVWFVLIERPCMDRHWPSKALARVRLLLRSVRESV